RMPSVTNTKRNWSPGFSPGGVRRTGLASPRPATSAAVTAATTVKKRKWPCVIALILARSGDRKAVAEGDTRLSRWRLTKTFVDNDEIFRQHALHGGQADAAHQARARAPPCSLGRRSAVRPRDPWEIGRASC